MDVLQNQMPSAAATVQPGLVVERAATTKVQPVESSDGTATLPADKPFVAQVVAARLSGIDYPENPTEIAPPERTLRPYDVPMLPAEVDEDDVMTKPLPDPMAATSDPVTEPA